MNKGKKYDQKEAYNKLQKFVDTQSGAKCREAGSWGEIKNKKFYDFLGYKDLDAFKKEYECICQLFVEKDRFFHLGKIDEEKENWVEVMQTLNNLERMVMIPNKDAIRSAS